MESFLIPIRATLRLGFARSSRGLLWLDVVGTQNLLQFSTGLSRVKSIGSVVNKIRASAGRCAIDAMIVHHTSTRWIGKVRSVKKCVARPEGISLKVHWICRRDWPRIINGFVINRTEILTINRLRKSSPSLIKRPILSVPRLSEINRGLARLWSFPRPDRLG